MDQLQAQLADLEAQKAKLFEDGNADQVLVSRLNEQIKAVQAQIAQLTATQEQIEEKVNNDGIPFAISGVDFTKLPTELITVIDLIVKADRRKIYTDQAAIDSQRDTDNAAYRSQADQRIATLQQDYTALEQECLDVRAELKNQTAETLKAISERDEARTNRDNAAAQLDEANKEIARLNSQVADYQKAKVFGEVAAQSIIDVDASETDAINTALDKLYARVENWGSINKVIKPDGSFELVKNADLSDWAPAVGGSETSQGTFPEVVTADAENSELPSTEGAVTPPPFPGSQAEDLAEATSGAGDAVVPTMVDGAVTREEFEALKRDVEALKQGQLGVAA